MWGICLRPVPKYQAALATELYAAKPNEQSNGDGVVLSADVDIACAQVCSRVTKAAKDTIGLKTVGPQVVHLAGRARPSLCSAMWRSLQVTRRSTSASRVRYTRLHHQAVLIQRAAGLHAESRAAQSLPAGAATTAGQQGE